MNPFTELDLEKLKVIIKRWVKQMKLQDGWFEEVILYRYAAPHFRERTSLQYAVVFDVTHVEQPWGETLQDLMAKYIEGIFLDPYISFLSKTNYFKWLSLFTPNIPPEDESDDPLFIHSRRFAEQSGMGMPPPFVDNEVDFPPYFKEKDFIHVYRGCPPDNWTKQWLFVPLFKDCLLPDQIQTDESIVLYSRLAVTLNKIFDTPMRDDRATWKEQAEGINNNVSPVTLDKDLWSFTLNGPMWDVTFEGGTGHVEDCTPVRRMLRTLEQPGVKFNYIELSQKAGKSKTEQEGVSLRGDIAAEEGLSDQENGREKHTKREIDTMVAALYLQYKTYLENQEMERDKWLELKRIAETNYGRVVTETDDGLKVTKSKWGIDSDPDLIKARKAISSNRIEFFNRIQHLQGLHEHMTRFLKIENGIIYTPPEGSPYWQINQ
ncbi:MAG: hypothetical protein RBR67_15505 [Desulfobacterium sp.]|jgi:hypothetical protein|nr:hypothetical protein [Desulfobacterium sp.]